MSSPGNNFFFQITIIRDMQIFHWLKEKNAPNLVMILSLLDDIKNIHEV